MTNLEKKKKKKKKKMMMMMKMKMKMKRKKQKKKKLLQKPSTRPWMGVSLSDINIIDIFVNHLK